MPSSSRQSVLLLQPLLLCSASCLTHVLPSCHVQSHVRMYLPHPTQTLVCPNSDVPAADPASTNTYACHISECLSTSASFRHPSAPVVAGHACQGAGIHYNCHRQTNEHVDKSQQSMQNCELFFSGGSAGPLNSKRSLRSQWPQRVRWTGGRIASRAAPGPGQHHCRAIPRVAASQGAAQMPLRSDTVADNGRKQGFKCP